MLAVALWRQESKKPANVNDQNLLIIRASVRGTEFYDILANK